MIIKKATIRI